MAGNPALSYLGPPPHYGFSILTRYCNVTSLDMCKPCFSGCCRSDVCPKGFNRCKATDGRTCSTPAGAAREEPARHGMEIRPADVHLHRRVIQVVTVIMIAAWVWQYLGGVSLTPTAVSIGFALTVDDLHSMTHTPIPGTIRITPALSAFSHSLIALASASREIVCWRCRSTPPPTTLANCSTGTHS